MEASEEQIIIKTTNKEIAATISSTKNHNPGLRALLSIKKNTATLHKDYAELLQIESELDELNKKGFSIIEANTSLEAAARWKEILLETDNSVTKINDVLSVAIEKIAQNEKEVYQDLWKHLAIQITAVKDNSKNLADSGLKLLHKAIHPQWDKDFVTPLALLVESLVAQVESCRVLVQVNERYTPEELNSLNQIIADHVPPDFTYEEAKQYQEDYYKALVNFKKEFKKDKNLWDKFLDILAGGTHQLPSEGAMMERWLEGEEAEP